MGCEKADKLSIPLRHNMSHRLLSRIALFNMTADRMPAYLQPSHGLCLASPCNGCRCWPLCIYCQLPAASQGLPPAQPGIAAQPLPLSMWQGTSMWLTDTCNGEMNRAWDTGCVECSCPASEHMSGHTAAMSALACQILAQYVIAQFPCTRHHSGQLL